MILKQPLFLKATEKYLKYEYNRDGISHFYAFTADGDIEHALGIPDDCVDILYCCNQVHPEIIISGTGFYPRPLLITRGENYFGVRFQPGFMPDFKTVSFYEIVASDAPFEELIRQNRAAETIFTCSSFLLQIRTFLNMYYHDYYSGCESRDCMETFVKDSILRSHGSAGIRSLSADAGYSEAYVIRRFRQCYGMTPKKFSEIIQFQYSMKLIGDQDVRGHFADVAAESNYYDESHMLRAFRRNINMTPETVRRYLCGTEYKSKLVISGS